MKPDSKPSGQQSDSSGVTQNPFALRGRREEAAGPSVASPRSQTEVAPNAPKRPAGILWVGVLSAFGAVGVVAYLLFGIGGTEEASAESKLKEPVRASNQEEVQKSDLQGTPALAAPSPAQQIPPAQVTAPLSSTVGEIPTLEASQPAASTPPPAPTAAQVEEAERQIQSLLATAREEPVTTERLALVARLGVQLASVRSLVRSGDTESAMRRMESIRSDAGRVVVESLRGKFDAEVARLGMDRAKDLMPEEWASLEDLFVSAKSLVDSGDAKSGMELAKRAIGQLPLLKGSVIERLRTSARESVVGGDVRMATELYLQINQLDTGDSEALTHLSAHFHSPGELLRTPLGFEFSFIPPGRFMQGSPETETGRDADEQLREVQITRGFHLLRTEVTQTQWDAVMGEGASARLLATRKAVPVGGSLPMHSITYEEAAEFCKRLSELEKSTARLPTEAEWEYAARAGSSAAYSNGGSTLGANEAVVDDPSVILEGPAAVASIGAPNAWGLRDLHGNVFEWTSDWSAPYAPGKQIDPRGPSDSDIGRVDLAMKVVRGGSWRDSPRAARFANRGEQSPVVGDNSVGFRVLREVRTFER